MEVSIPSLANMATPSPGMNSTPYTHDDEMADSPRPMWWAFYMSLAPTWHQDSQSSVRILASIEGTPALWEPHCSLAFKFSPSL